MGAPPACSVPAMKECCNPRLFRNTPNVPLGAKGVCRFNTLFPCGSVTVRYTKIRLQPTARNLI
jgi:hypothetical protein